MLKIFFDFVEIRTKLASVIPIFVSLSFVFYLSGRINFQNSIIFIFAAILFDMSTTAINNTIDSRQENTKSHYSFFTSILIIFSMILLSSVLGIYLVSRTGIILLLVGTLCFAIGILYTFGPIPISRTPYGEIFSGGVMGFFIPFIVLYINMPKNFLAEVNYIFGSREIYFNFDLFNLLKLFIFSVPMILCISNIMLANNICDIEKDPPNKRFTIVYYIGKENSLKLFKVLYIVSYLFIILGACTNVIPVICLGSLITVPAVSKNINLFFKVQTKKETFSVSIKNFILITVSYGLLILAGGFIIAR